MNIKRMTAILAFATIALTAAAGTGDKKACPADCGAEEKPVRIAVSLTMGPSSYSSAIAQSGNLPVYEAEAPSANWMDKGTAFGIEGSVLFRSGWRIDLGGSYGYSVNPGKAGLAGTASGGVLEPGDIPEYRAVASQQSNAFLAYIAGGYCFKVPSAPALKPYVGLKVLGSYAHNWKNYNEMYSMGTSVTETLAIGVSAVLGVDYFLGRNFYLGASVDAVRYVYSYTAMRPQEGLGALAASAHNIGAIAAPVLKIGFVF